MMVVRPYFYALLAPSIMVEGRKNSGWWACFIQQTGGKERRAAPPHGKIQPVEIRKRIENCLDFISVDAAVFYNLLIRIRIGNIHSAPEVA